MNRNTYFKIGALALSLIAIALLILKFGEELTTQHPSFFIVVEVLFLLGSSTIMYLLLIEDKHLYEYRIVQKERIFEGTVLRTTYVVEQLKYSYFTNKSKWSYVDYYTNLIHAERLVNELKSQTKKGVITKETIICPKEQ